jgi:hypothetical protein
MLPIEEAPDPISVPGGSRPPPAGIDFNATATTSDSGSGSGSGSDSLSRSPSTGIANDKIKEMTRQTRGFTWVANSEFLRPRNRLNLKVPFSFR